MAKFIVINGLPEGGSAFVEVARIEMDDTVTDADTHGNVEAITETLYDVLKGTSPNTMNVFNEKFGGNVFAIHKFCAFKVTFFDSEG